LKATIKKSLQNLAHRLDAPELVGRADKNLIAHFYEEGEAAVGVCELFAQLDWEVEPLVPNRTLIAMSIGGQLGIWIDQLVVD